MLIEAKELQQKAVEKLYSCVFTENKKDFVFKAPTGSGKTYMMANFCNKVLSNISDMIFVISSLSKADLAEQNYSKFEEYKQKGFFKNFDCYLINSETTGEERLFIPENYNIYFLPKDLYKSKSKLLETGAFEGFLQEIKRQNKKIVWIKDECHIESKNLNKYKEVFYKIINFSATPKIQKGDEVDVELKEEDCVNVKLIKQVEWFESDFNIKEQFKKILDKYREIKESYSEKLHINPCLIVQISNKDKGQQEWEIIKEILETQNLKWMYIVDNLKECDTNDNFKSKKLPVAKWKEYVKENNSLIDVIIFKMVVTEGYDIPRACMLYQVRDTESRQLDEQVVGRIRRNPKLLNFEELNDQQQYLATTGYVWGIEPKNRNKQYALTLKNKEAIVSQFTIKTTKLKPLTEKTDFDIEEFLNNQSDNIVQESIFDLGKRLKKSSLDVRNIIYKYSSDYQKWFTITQHINKIEKESEKYICDYESSMEIDKEISFSLRSYCIKTEYYREIENWVWQIKNDSDNEFYFDSEAEKGWAKILKDISKENCEKATNVLGEELTLWGKNYLPNSNIKFEYYSNGNHFSYPDFVMKDKFGRIHIFEVKSVNVSNSQYINTDEYENKIRELKNLYKTASRLTKQFFYIPILKENSWQIINFINGEEQTITQEQFIESINNI